jgi:hypothetical protein
MRGPTYRYAAEMPGKLRFDDALMTNVTRREAETEILVLLGGALGVQNVADQASGNHGDEGLDARLRGQAGMLDFIELAHVLDGSFGFLGERFDGLLLFCRITCGIAQDGHGSSEVAMTGASTTARMVTERAPRGD